MEPLNRSVKHINPCVCGCCDACKCNCDFSRFLDMKNPISSTSGPFSTHEAAIIGRKSDADLTLQLISKTEINSDSVSLKDNGFTSSSSSPTVSQRADSSKETSTIDDRNGPSTYDSGSYYEVPKINDESTRPECTDDKLSCGLVNHCLAMLKSAKRKSSNLSSGTEKLASDIAQPSVSLNENSDPVESCVSCFEENVCHLEHGNSNGNIIANGNRRQSSLSPVSPVIHKMVLVSDLPKKEKGYVGDVVEAFVTHVETPSDFYIVPKSNFTCGSRAMSLKVNSKSFGEDNSAHKTRKLQNLPPLFCASDFDVELVRRFPINSDFRYMQYQDMVSKLSCYMYAEFEAYQQLNYLIGEVVAANTIIQGKDVWMRGVVIDVYYSNAYCEHLYEIQLIDYGRTDIVPWNSVAGLPVQFATVQPLAYKCSVGGIMPVFGSLWSCRAIQMFKDLLGGPGKDVLVEITLLESGKQRKRQWQNVFERKPYTVDISVIDENRSYESNIAHELSFGPWNTACAVPVGTVPWFSRLNLWWGKKWKRDGWND